MLRLTRCRPLVTHLGRFVSRYSTQATQDSVPWYLREEVSSPLNIRPKIELPTIPPHAPASVNEFLHLLAHDFGINDLTFFDLTALDPSHDYSSINQPADYIIIGTGKSPNHIYKAASELRLHIKKHHDLLPAIEGMVSSTQSPVARRRMLRRARKGPLATDNMYGKNPNTWVMCDTLVDNLFIHVLTKERRADLNLESLYCLPQDAHLYEKKQARSQDSDNIFSGIRRYSTSTKPSLLAEVKKLPLESDFSKYSSAEDHQLAHAIHVVAPETVPFGRVEQLLLQSENRPQAVVDYLKLLLDSPELAALNVDPKEFCDVRADRLSAFLSRLYTFSLDDFDLSHPEIVPLLWRLSYVESSPSIGSRQIDNVIEGSSELHQMASSPSIIQAGNLARSILDVVEQYSSHHKLHDTLAFRELRLWTYGNAAKWNLFWAEWDAIRLTNTFTPEQRLHGWVRLVVYLAMRNDQAQMIHFLNNHWLSSSGVSGAFFEDFAGEFNTSEEKQAFLTAIDRILLTVNEAESLDQIEAFAHVKTFVDELR